MKKNYIHIIFYIFIGIFIYILLLKAGIIEKNYFEGKSNLGEVLNEFQEDANEQLNKLQGKGEDTLEPIVEKTSGTSILNKLQVNKEPEEKESLLDKLKKNSQVTYEGNNQIKSFNQAKKILESTYREQISRKSVYCNCSFKSNKTIDYNNCNYKGTKYKNRSQKIEWEHIVPAENFGRSFLEWREPEKFDNCKKKSGGYYSSRTCANTNKDFSFMAADLYNLYPAIGSLNALRSNYQIDEIIGERRDFGSCDIEIHNRKVEPPKDMKGDVARVYLYMQKVYSQTNIIGNKTKSLIEKWDKEDPISKEECDRYKILKQYQKNINPILEPYCL